MTFTITNNTITAYTTLPSELPEGAATFTSLKQLTVIAASWPMARLVAVYNAFAGVTPVQRFMTRAAGCERLWKHGQTLTPTPVAPIAAANQRPVSKKALVLALLQQDCGTTIAAIMSATNWQAHSVRGFISTQKKHGATVTTTGAGEERTYRIAR